MAKKHPENQNAGKEAPAEFPVTEEPLQAGKDSPIPESSVDEAASMGAPKTPSEPLSSVELGAEPVSKAPFTELPVQDGGDFPTPEVSPEEPEQPIYESEQSPAPPEAEPAEVSADAPVQDAPPEDRLEDWEQNEVQAKAPKAKRSRQADAPSQEAENGEEPKLSPAQKAAETRKARKGVVIDFLEGKRTSPFVDGKPITPKLWKNLLPLFNRPNPWKRPGPANRSRSSI